MISKNFFVLLDIQTKLRAIAFNELGLKHLQPLRDEVDAEVERLCAEGRAKKETDGRPQG